MNEEKNPINQNKIDTKPTALSAKEEYERLQAQSKKLKKRMLVAVSALLATLLLLFGIVQILSSVDQQPYKIPEGMYHFEPTYQGNIMENTEYLSVDRLVYYCDNPNGYGLRQGITEDNRETFAPSVLFLCDWLDTIVAGDAVAYNNCFTADYWTANEKEGNMRKTSFSPQMVYDIEVVFQSQTSQNGGNRFTYKLEYRILHNDGSFRTDIGSKMSRTQYVTVQEVAKDTYLIDELRSVYPAVETKTVSVTTVLLILGGVILVIGGCAFGIHFVRARRKKKAEKA